MLQAVGARTPLIRIRVKSSNNGARLLMPHCSKRCLSSSSSSTIADLLRDATVQVNGEYKAREYHLISPMAPPSEAVIASLRGNGNMLWGAKSSRTKELAKVCTPLVERALKDIEKYGEQAQAVAAMPGLCDWVCESYFTNKDSTAVLENFLKEEADGNIKDMDKLIGAVKAIATNQPRPGHSVVGQGTFRDAEAGWQALARDFAIRAGKVGAHECELYGKSGAMFVGIQYLADTSPAYLRSAGGSMASFIFANVAEWGDP
mmetsp:Transcript_24013/g.37010  ORF Transcript_24013/g.37010 Transcript_24013/m.37010 type:complete len:261 (+) Transcript_24013:27-809(+)